ncbi:mucin-4-like [Bombina bombina]|uniref:mucin-4-like n=1 Tax=Bombina bombina TaxID=8345 RepID=UPI00235AADC1|nr:mucin-4-like [Bombina bombina]
MPPPAHASQMACQSNNVKMLRSTIPSISNAGVRCLYYGGNQYLEGYQEKVHSFAESDEELLAYDWCCKKVDDTAFCSKYKQKRIPINCRDYTPLSPAWMYGDPHITTLDGFSYTFNGLGDFTLINASGSGTSFVLQGRTAQTGTALATNFVAFAAFYNSSSTSIKVEWYLNNSDISVYVNATEVSFTDSQDMDAKINSSYPDVFLQKNNSVTATFKGILSESITTSVSSTYGMLNAMSSLPSQFIDKTQGLLGRWNSNPDDDLVKYDGTSIPKNSSEEEIFNFGMTWRIDEGSAYNLFTKFSSGQKVKSSATFKPLFLNDLIAQNSTQYEAISQACKNNTECIYDALSTKNRSFGLATMEVSNRFQVIKKMLNSNPPVINGSITIYAFMGETVTSLYRSNSTVTFSAAESYPDVTVSALGVLTWKPTSKKGFNFLIVAKDSENLASSLQIKFVLCDCRIKEECNNAQTYMVNETSLSIASCNCKNNYTGDFCKTAPNLCAQECFPGVTCNSRTGCGPCPAGLTGDGLQCKDINECESNNLCPAHSTCVNSLSSYKCICNEGYTWNGVACCSACDQIYCNNGGTCINTGESCTKKCICHPAFSDSSCTVAGNNFPAALRNGTRSRTIILTLKSSENISKQDAFDKVNATMELYSIKQLKDVVTLGNSFTNGLPTNFTAEFTYIANGLAISRLNDLAVPLIQQDISKTNNGRSVTNITITHVYDGDRLTLGELKNAFTCDLYGYSGYTLNTETFECVSDCVNCKNDASCYHLKNETICRCKPFTMYTTSGKHCEILSMNLNAFFGILFGALAFLFLFMIGVGLAIYFCRKKKRNIADDTEQFYNTEIVWKKTPFSSSKMKKSSIPNLTQTAKEPHLISWTPNLEKVDISQEVKIKRPDVSF